ncbi:hypothetical protein OC844_004247 [Tilletia horrida]|nr:hypothetical protein OC844_004247 [Tilletia horrida]
MSQVRRYVLALLCALILLSSQARAALRGAPWGVDDRWNRRILGGASAVRWYHHWALGPIASASPDVEFVPMFWGPAKNKSWVKRKAEMSRNPPMNLLAFNEPDIPTQANLTPAAALDLYMSELWPLKANFTSVRLSSPQICFNLTWLDEFMAGAQSLAAEPDFLAVHWYGAPKLVRFQNYVNQIHAAHPTKELWITELGLTNKANVSATTAQNFMQQLLTWADAQPFIARITWTGFFAQGSPPDSYISPSMALFAADGTVNNLGMAYAGIQQNSSTAFTPTFAPTPDHISTALATSMTTGSSSTSSIATSGGTFSTLPSVSDGLKVSSTLQGLPSPITTVSTTKTSMERATTSVAASSAAGRSPILATSVTSATRPNSILTLISTATVTVTVTKTAVSTLLQPCTTNKGTTNATAALPVSSESASSSMLNFASCADARPDRSTSEIRSPISPFIEFVPTMWGPQRASSWHDRKHEMKSHPPKNVLAFNEPDIRSQSNLSPQAAVDLFMQELWPLKQRYPGVRLSSPQICHDRTWLAQFMSGLEARGAKPDFIAAHWYGPPDLDRFQWYINQLQSEYPGQDIWITELGLTQHSDVSPSQAEAFMEQVLNWAGTQPHLKRVAWTGFFSTNDPPDGFISPAMALFHPDGKLTGLGRAYAGLDSKQAREVHINATHDEERDGAVAHDASAMSDAAPATRHGAHSASTTHGHGRGHGHISGMARAIHHHRRHRAIGHGGRQEM